MRLPMPLDVPGECQGCSARKPPWLRAIVPLAWKFPVDVLISRFKYSGALHYGAVLGRLLAACCGGSQVDGIVPVPLHRRRLAERGFNQARELARPVAEHCGIPILDDACQRIMPTTSQAGLAAQQRYRNVRGAFHASSGVRGRRLAILDDVLTTGSTAQAVARELLRSGAAATEIWAVARGGTAQADANV
jgi:ComF family protein